MSFLALITWIKADARKIENNKRLQTKELPVPIELILPPIYVFVCPEKA